MLIIESVEANFKEVEKEIAKLHSYDTFVLISTPVNQTTEGVKKWVREELENNVYLSNPLI